MDIKAITTKTSCTGNRYGQITKGSRVTKEYGITIDGELHCEGYFLTLRGARLAVALIEQGLPVEDIDTFGDLDGVAAKAVVGIAKKDWREALANRAKELMADHQREQEISRAKRKEARLSLTEQRNMLRNCGVETLFDLVQLVHSDGDDVRSTLEQVAHHFSVDTLVVRQLSTGDLLAKLVAECDSEDEFMSLYNELDG